MDVLFRELREADDYLKIQEKLFEGMSVDEIFRKAAEHSRRMKGSE